MSSVKASSALAAPTPIANDNTELKLFSHVTGDNVEVEWELIEDEFVQVNLDENGSTTYESSDVVMNTSNNANTLGIQGALTTPLRFGCFLHGISKFNSSLDEYEIRLARLENLSITSVDHTINQFTAGNPPNNNAYVFFGYSTTLPANIEKRRIYRSVFESGSAFKISETQLGPEFDFTSNGSNVIAYQLNFVGPGWANRCSIDESNEWAAIVNTIAFPGDIYTWVLRVRGRLTATFKFRQAVTTVY